MRLLLNYWLLSIEVMTGSINILPLHVSLTLFLVIELKSAQPLINLRLLRGGEVEYA